MAMSLHDRQPSSVRGKNPAFRRPVSRVGKERLLRWGKTQVYWRNNEEASVAQETWAGYNDVSMGNKKSGISYKLRGLDFYFLNRKWQAIGKF